MTEHNEFEFDWDEIEEYLHEHSSEEIDEEQEEIRFGAYGMPDNIPNKYLQYDKRTEFEREIEQKVKEVERLCKANNIDFFMSFALQKHGIPDELPEFSFFSRSRIEDDACHFIAAHMAVDLPHALVHMLIGQCAKLKNIADFAHDMAEKIKRLFEDDE